MVGDDSLGQPIAVTLCFTDHIALSLVGNLDVFPIVTT